MRFAFIVPVLNEAAFIGATLASLAAARARGCVVVVVDGGSQDATVALSQSDADQVIQSPKGRARQMNAGAQVNIAACCDVLVFLHADTVFPEQGLEAMRDAVALGAAWGRFDVAIRGQSRLLPCVAHLMNLRSRVTGIATGDQAIFVRRDVFERMGGFADQPLMEDIDLSRRLLRESRPACLRHRVVTSGRRWDQHGALRTIVMMWRFRWQYWRGASAADLAKGYR